MLASRFDGLLIDCYGTMCSGDRAAVERTCALVVARCELPVNAQQFAILWGERFFDVIEQSNHEHFQTLYDCELASLRESLAPFGKTVDPAPFVAELEAYWRNAPLYPDTRDFLETVDVPVCCLSNADTQPLLATLTKHDLKFAAVVTSQSARCYKPDAKIFERGLLELDIKPDRALHIGDSLHSDVSGASRVGISTVWLCRRQRIHDIGNPNSYKPNCIIKSLRDMPGFSQQLA